MGSWRAVLRWSGGTAVTQRSLGGGARCGGVFRVSGGARSGDGVQGPGWGLIKGRRPGLGVRVQGEPQRDSRRRSVRTLRGEGREEGDGSARWVPGRSEGESGAGRGAKQAAVGRCAVERAERGKRGGGGRLGRLGLLRWEVLGGPRAGRSPHGKRRGEGTLG